MARKPSARKRHLEHLEETGAARPSPETESGPALGVGPRRGGIRQRLAEATAVAAAASSSSSSQPLVAPPARGGGIAQRAAKAAQEVDTEVTDFLRP